MSFFIKNAISATVNSSISYDGTFSLITISAIFVLFYCILIRPQNKKNKEHKKMINSIKKGDEIITVGGILAKVKQLNNEQYIKIELLNGIEIYLQKSSIHMVLPKDTIQSLYSTKVLEHK